MCDLWVDNDSKQMDQIHQKVNACNSQPFQNSSSWFSKSDLVMVISCAHALLESDGLMLATKMDVDVAMPIAYPALKNITDKSTRRINKKKKKKTKGKKKAV